MKILLYIFFVFAIYSSGISDPYTGRKWFTTSRLFELEQPYKWEFEPTPFLLPSKLSNKSLNDLLSQFTNAKNGKQKIEIMIDISKVYYGRNTDSAIIYANRALFKANQLKDEYLIAQANEIIAINSIIKSDYGFAFKSLYLALDIYEKLNCKLESANCYFYIGIINKLFAQAIDASVAFDKANEIYEKYNLKREIIDTKLFKAKYDIEYKHILMELDSLLDTKDQTDNIEDIYRKKALIYYILNDYENEFKCCKQSLNYSIKNNNQLCNAFNYFSLGLYSKNLAKKSPGYIIPVSSRHLDSSDYFNLSIHFFQISEIYFYNIGFLQLLQPTYYHLGSNYYELTKKHKDPNFILYDHHFSLLTNFLIGIQAVENEDVIVTKKIREEKSLKKTNETTSKTNSFVFSLLIVLVIVLIYIFKLFNDKRLANNKLQEQASAINKANSELLEANQIKNRLFSIISHDLKTPIYSFNSLTQLVTEYYERLSDQEKIHHINSLKESSSHIVKLLNNLLDWSRIQTHTINVYPENIKLSFIIENEANIQKQFALIKNIKLELQLSYSAVVYVDGNMLSFIIRNLISNAIKFTNPGGLVTISSISVDSKIEISVEDNGIGIKDEDIPRIFNISERISTFGTSYERGTGLGLNLCKEFVELNKGEIRFESTYQKGSKFIFTLPIGNSNPE